MDDSEDFRVEDFIRDDSFLTALMARSKETHDKIMALYHSVLEKDAQRTAQMQKAKLPKKIS